MSAGNSGPFTLDGTRTYLVGARRLAIIDPGPDAQAHLEAVAEAARGAEAAAILVTHGHPDHAPGAAGLARALEGAGVAVEVLGPAGVEGVARALSDGDAVPTDEGDLLAIETPGHARAHLSFHWPARSALFAGDLLLGKGDTVWVGEYAGSVADYMRSLERVRALGLRVIYPAHGPPLEDPQEALDRFAAHRRERIRQVEAALAEHPQAGVDELLELVYGTALPAAAQRAARMSMEALKAHVEEAREGA
ncbi:MAG TPA: MBL fold metallo-hydrolase [Longimicrobiales bacterium]|nr:MBL fold metallo-hydrolase [Longimicrobiales bacterium]